MNCTGFTGPSTGPSAKSSASSISGGGRSGNILLRRHRIPCAATARANSIRSKATSRNGWRKIPALPPPSSSRNSAPWDIREATALSANTCGMRGPSRPNAPSSGWNHLAGERFEVDWGHFGALNYSGDSRKLYAIALVDAHSRMLYVEFTHSQSFGTFARCHTHAFDVLGGVAREIAYDNLATAVVEHDGRLIRFLPRFLGFARDHSFFPHACNPASGWEKGKIERAIGYLRQNFWPLREFTDLHDVNRQVRQWLSEVANQRLHRETRERPLERFKPEALRALPVIPYDYRDSS